MHHLLQLDCAALAHVDPDMPKAGVLSFFLTGSQEERGAPSVWDGEAGAFCVLYQPEVPEALQPRLHPDTCPALGESSFAIEHVRHDVPQKKKSFLQRLVNTQPKAYSKSGGTGFFAEVPLEAVPFDSHPLSDSATAREALGAGQQDHPVRALQILGYAPSFDDLKTAHREGYRACSDEKALAAYEKAAAREDVLLAQFAHSPTLNFDLLREKYALQFRITRSDLRARAFDRVSAIVVNLGQDGLWWPPNTPSDIDWATATDLSPEIALKPLTPFERPQSGANYFCGTPQLPDDIEWPHRRDGYPLGFLMQVDCASLPRSVGTAGQYYDLPAFPETGTIFVFADDFMEELGDDSIRVLYTPDSTGHLPGRTPPDALKSPPDYAFHNIKQRAVENGVTRPEPKRPFDPVAFVNVAYPKEDDPDFAEKHALRQTYGGALPHEEHAFPEATLLIDWLPNYTAITFGPNWSSEIHDTRAPVRSIPKSFPWRWGDIADATAFFPQNQYDSIDEDKRRVIFAADLINEGQEWKEKASLHDALDRITDDERAEYRDWLLRMDDSAHNIPFETPKETAADYRYRMEMQQTFEGVMDRLARPYPYVGYNSLPTTLHYLAYQADAEDLPDEMREVVAEIVRFQRSDTQLRGNSQVHRPDPDLMFSSDEKNRSDEDEVLLFSLASGSGLPVTWADCCWLQIWINAEDLRAGRFDRIKPSIRW